MSGCKETGGSLHKAFPFMANQSSQARNNPEKAKLQELQKKMFKELVPTWPSHLERA